MTKYRPTDPKIHEFFLNHCLAGNSAYSFAKHIYGTTKGFNLMINKNKAAKEINELYKTRKVKIYK